MMEERQAEAEFAKSKNRVSARLRRKLKAANKYLIKCQNVLKSCQEWNLLHHEALLLQANLFRISKKSLSVVVSDWEQEGRERSIALDPSLEPKEQIAKRFKQSRKLRLGMPHAERQLQHAEQELHSLRNQMATLETVQTMQELDQFCQGLGWRQADATQPKIKEPPKPYHAFISNSGMSIWVGKNAKSNDQLTFRYAKGSDWWLHMRDFSGSHIVLRCTKDQTPDEESIKDAAELALRFSGSKSYDEGEVCFTQVKNLRRMKSPGQVALSKHKVIRIKTDEARWQRLRANRTS